ncbi:MAG: hypothetical protein HZA54_21140 [Planctomycetes bacterium]|nr:hypothetical protein [Planctomycetota bacterium]
MHRSLFFATLIGILGALPFVPATAQEGAGAGAAPPEYRRRVERAGSALAAGDADRALIGLAQALEACGDDPAAWRLLVRVARARRDADLTLLASARLADLAPAVPGAPPAPGEAGGAAAATDGPPARVIAAYLGRTAVDGERTAPSVAAGAPLLSQGLLALALDAQGRRCRGAIAWRAAEGLAIDDPGDPPIIRAGAQPGDVLLTAHLRDLPEGPAATLTIRVIGPLARLAVEPARTVARIGAEVGLVATPVDAAGHRLWVPELAWSIAGAPAPAPDAAAAATATPVELYRPTSRVGSGDFFQSHRNHVTVRGPAGRTVRVVVTPPEGAVRGTAEIVGEAGGAASAAAAEGGAAAAGIPWGSDYEAAGAAARAADRCLLVEVMSEW